MRTDSYNQIPELLNPIIEDAIKNHVFSGCSVGFVKNSETKSSSEIYNYGFTNGDEVTGISKNAIYDLASLTKPLVTALCVFELIDRGKLHFEDTLGTFFRKIPDDKRKISLIHLLNHSSGFPAHNNYFDILRTIPLESRWDKLIKYILKEKLEFIPGSCTVYSDLGYFLLGKIVEQVSEKKLDLFWRESFSIPLKLEKEVFFRGIDVSNCRDFVETGRCSWSNRRLCGLVNDDNCRVLQGVAGHAGLFGSAKGVLSLCEHLLFKNRESSFPLNTKNSTSNQKTIVPGSWYYGFDTPTPVFSSSGKYFSKQTVGHLGFTGTSFWLDLLNGIGVVFLTNRVLFSEKTSAIKKLRPRVHNIVMKNLIKKA